MIKVLRIINRLNLGGPTYNAANLTKFLNTDFETLLVAGNRDKTEASSEFICTKLGIEPRYIPNMNRSIHPINDYDALRNLKKIIKEFKPDIVHTHASKAGTLGRIAASQCNVPAVVHTFHGHVFHSYFSPIKSRFFLEIERWLAKKSSKIVAISNLQKAELSNRFRVCSDEKITVIPLGFDLEKFETDMESKRNSFRMKYKLSNDEIAIGIIGRLVPIKNHQLFLNAIKEMSSLYGKKIRAFIIGDGELKESILNEAKAMQIDYCEYSDNYTPCNLTFTSWIQEIDEVVAGLDIVALTSLNEGTPVSLIEAQAGSKPVITTDVGGIRDIVKHNVSGYVVDATKNGLYSKFLSELIEDGEKRRKFGEAGRATVIEQFSYKRLCQDTANLYNSLLF